MKCPFKHILKPREDGDTKPAACLTPHAPPPSAPSAAAAESSGVCPLGFSSGKQGSALSPNSCSMCRSILHRPARVLPCNHYFCSQCISSLRDCPACGRDIEEKTLDGDLNLQALASIDEAILAVDSPSLKASVYLQLGTQSLSGGNHEAAFDRLGLCLSVLSSVKESSSSSDPKIDCQMGAVLGMQGDCKKKAGEVQEALNLYQAALSALGPASEEEEATKLMAITHNKQGDLCYTLGDHSRASECYKSALWIRRKAVEQHQPPKSSPVYFSMALDLAASLIKLADVVLAAREGGLEEMQSLEDPVSLFEEAKKWLESVEPVTDREGKEWEAIFRRRDHLRSTLHTLKS